MPAGSQKSIRAHASIALCALLALPLASGCNSGKQVQWDLHARELRLQEDEIYRLEDCIEDYQAIIRSLRRENIELKQSLGQPLTTKATKLDEEESSGERSLLDDLQWSPDRPTPKPPSSEPLPPTPPASPTTNGESEGESDVAPDIALPPIDGGELGDAPAFDDPPAIELPTNDETEPGATPPAPLEQASPFGDDPPNELLPAPSIPSGEAGGEEQPAEEVAPLFEPQALFDPSRDPLHNYGGIDNATVMPTTSLAPALEDLIPVASVALVSDPGPPEATGEATIVALVRPLSPVGETTLFQGEVSLVLRYPQRTDAKAQIARWDYSPSEVASSWRNMEKNPLLDFALILPHGAPTGQPLDLWVQLVDSAGRKKRGKTEVVLTLPTRMEESQPLATKPQAEETSEKQTTPLANGWTSRTPTKLEPAVTPAGYWEEESSTQRASEIRASEIRVTGLDESEQDLQ